MKTKHLFLVLILLLCCLMPSFPLRAAEEGSSEDPEDPVITFRLNDAEDFGGFFLTYDDWYNTADLSFTLTTDRLVPEDIFTPDDFPKLDIDVSCADPSLLSVDFDPQNQYLTEDPYSRRYRVSLETLKVGKTSLTITVESEAYEVPILIFPYNNDVEIKSIKTVGVEKVKLTWKPKSVYDGYAVCLADTQEFPYTFEPLALIEGNKTSSATVSARLNVPLQYAVLPCYQVGDHLVYYEKINFYDVLPEHTAELPETKLVSVNGKAGKLTVTWKKTTDAVSYEIYRSTQENGTYKKIKTVQAPAVKFSQKVKKGVPYYYKVRPVFKKYTGNLTGSLSGFIPKSGKAKAVTVKKLKTVGQSEGLYHSFNADPPTVYLYASGKSLYVVSLQENRRSLKVYRLDSSFKLKSTKTIRLPSSMDIFGGFYHGTDGKNYVAVGRANTEESTKRTVIQVIQYSSRWKKMKTASIPGGFSNVFEGIVSPFSFSSFSMDLKGQTLYLMTARLMFAIADVRHQSNIAFAIDTKTMKAKEDNWSYVSHSFNQIVHFKDDSLYLADHGDAYPRSIQITLVDHYGEETFSQLASEPFEFMGETGVNSTGCEMTGMEVGKTNVLTCGRSLPHQYAVKNVTGWDLSWKKNLFVTTTNRKTGKNKVIWLTKYNPKTTKKEVGQPRMVKLSDTRFAILVSIDRVLNYYVINDSGKILKHTTYKKIPFRSTSQPILYQGSIVWHEQVTRADYSTVSKICRIPAL